MSSPWEGNLSKAHKHIKWVEKALEGKDVTTPVVSAHVAIGFLHVFIELTAQIRDYVKNQTK